jgi:N-acetylmuramoyl-L-alanine amidase
MVETKRMAHRRPRLRAFAALVMLAPIAIGVAAARAADDSTGRIERIELKADAASTKVLVMLSRPVAFHVRVLKGDAAKKSARRLVLDFDDTTLGPEATKPIVVANGLIGEIRTGQFNAKTARVVLDLGDDTTHSVDAFESPPHVTIALAGSVAGGAPPVGASGASAAADADTPAPAAAPTGGTPSVGAGETSKSPTRTLPVRARGRRPYSLMYSR